jgi:hypothetical protein
MGFSVHVIAARQLMATLSLAQVRASNSQPASRVQILSGHYNTAVRVPLPLQLRESEMFDLGSVPYKDSDELVHSLRPFCSYALCSEGQSPLPGTFRFCRRTPQRNGRNRRQQQP